MTYDRYQHQEIIDAIAASQTTISGGISVDLGDVETDLDSLVTSSSSLDSKVTTVNTNLGTINTSVGAGNTTLGLLNTSATSRNSKLDALNATVSGTNTRLDTANTNLGTVNTNLTSNVYGRYSGSIRTTDVVVSGSIASLVPVNNLSNRRDIIVMNTSSSTIYLGGSTVTRFNGIPVISGTVFSMPLGSAQLYAVTPDTGTTVSGVRVLEVS